MVISKQPTIVFIFGGSGDLTYRKLMPALFNLFTDGYLAEKMQMVAVGRNPYTDIAFRRYIKKGVEAHSRRKPDTKQWAAFSKKIRYATFDLTAKKTYAGIAALIKEVQNGWEEKANLIYYLSVAPQLAPVIAENLFKAKLAQDAERSRIVFEKPFGHDLQSAKELNALLRKMFREKQIYRIDHYLGKETVQNILALRFANILFEPSWNHHYIDHVQITAAESIGVEGRGGYYEGSGALRDMLQNHMLQLLCMVAMEAPTSFDADEIRNKKLDVLNAIRKWKKEEVHQYAVRGQYGKGWIKSEEAKPYRLEKGVNPQSPVETFAAVQFFVDNWRWKDVPFYLRTGKHLGEKETLITIQFKPAPDYSFPKEAGETWRPNRLTISIQPCMDIRLRFQAKTSGPEMLLQPVDMTFSYAKENEQPEAYETLLEDVIEGNPTLFMRADQVEAAWSIITPIMELWQSKPPVDFPNYAPGTWGPEDAEALIAKDGRHWFTLPA